MTVEANMYKRALRVTLIGMAVLAVIAIPVGLLVDGPAGLFAAAIGVVVAVLAGVTTQVMMVVSHTRAPQMMAAMVLGSWLLKMVIIVIALLVLQGVEGFHKGLFVTFFLVGVFGALAADLWAVRTARIPYVDPGSK